MYRYEVSSSAWGRTYISRTNSDGTSELIILRREERCKGYGRLATFIVSLVLALALEEIILPEPPGILPLCVLISSAENECTVEHRRNWWGLLHIWMRDQAVQAVQRGYVASAMFAGRARPGPASDIPVGAVPVQRYL